VRLSLSLIVTVCSVCAQASKLLRTPLTVAASGDVTQLPRYDELSAKLQ
jgi:hypothetical protein